LKKVLFVTYHFPPSGSSKTRRTLKFLKYLTQFSWEPTVLTVREGRVFNFDPSLLGELPEGIRVHRTSALSFSSRRTLAETEKLDNEADGTRNAPKLLLKKLFKFIKPWATIPDEFITWLPHALFKGISVIHNEGVEVIYSTAPPCSNHIVALLLKRYTRRPLVVDFRDAWIANPARKWRSYHARRALESFLERVVIKNADLVIATTEGITQDFRARYSREPAGKFVTLPNGYDRAEFKVLENPDITYSDKMRIVHTGYLLRERSPKPFLEALRQLIDERPLLENEVEVCFIGESSRFLDGKRIEDYIEQYCLEGVVKLYGHVSRREATQHQMHADILLLIIGVVPKEQVFTYGIASKVFDYMMAKKPILAIADKGPVSELVEKAKIGGVLEPLDVEGIKQFLSVSYDAYKENKLHVNADTTEIAKYDVHLITEKLAGLFNTCIQKKTPMWSEAKG
jgi:glycosyltransferase involved in cell wall biosynthesis